MKITKRIISLIFTFALCIGTSYVPASAYTDTDFYENRYENLISLPYSADVTFSHTMSSTDDASSHNILDSRLYAFRAEKGCIVGVLFQKGSGRSGEQELKSSVSAKIYSDTGAKIAQAETVSEGEIDGAHIEFIPAYTGIYYVELSSRATNEGEYTSSISIQSTKKYQKNSISKLPHSFNYSKNTHKTVTLSDLFQNKEYTNLGVDTNISVIEFTQEAGSIFSYKINTPDRSDAITANLVYRTGDVYELKSSSPGENYTSGDAAELGYSGASYLIVYSNGTFTLSADMLSHEKYVIYDLASDFCGKLDVSNASPMYDQQKISELITDFPFSDIENRDVVFFKLQSEQSSVISYLCDRREHKYFSLVSDLEGLSPISSYPLRHYGSYCSEVSPSKLCYNAYISDSTSAYLCYTGTDTYSYVELYTSKTHSSDTVFEPKYKPDSLLPSISIANIYNDSDIYSKLGTEAYTPDAVRIGGYLMVGAEGERYYYSSTDRLTVPDEHGTVKIYALICAVYNSGTSSEVSRYHAVHIGDIVSDKGFLIPIIEDIVEYITDNPKESTAFIVFIIIPVIACTIMFIIFIKKKKSTKKTILLSNANDPEKEDTTDKENKGGI